VHRHAGCDILSEWIGNELLLRNELLSKHERLRGIEMLSGNDLATDRISKLAWRELLLLRRQLRELLRHEGVVLSELVQCLLPGLLLPELVLRR
jgi:hypothetical protein